MSGICHEAGGAWLDGEPCGMDAAEGQRCDWHQPVRILSVTGTFSGAQASTTASTMAKASGSSCIRADPAHLLQTFLAGQPMLMSMICAPRSML